MITTCSDKQCDAEDLQLSSRDKSFNQASTQIDNDARFELWVLDAIEQANRAEDEMSQATEQVGQAVEQAALCPSSCNHCQATHAEGTNACKPM
jgi:hypothetical protein